MDIVATGALVFVAIILIMLLFVGMGLIDLDEIRYRPHAVIAHGDAAIAARDVIQNCGQGLQAYNCPSTITQPDAYLFVCPLDSTNVSCAGMYVGSRGAELTSWIMPCSKWYAKAAVCVVR